MVSDEEILLSIHESVCALNDAIQEQNELALTAIELSILSLQVFAEQTPAGSKNLPDLIREYKPLERLREFLERRRRG